MKDHEDIEIEPVRGLPELPPEGERILWQGRPAWGALAWRAFGVRLVALYFAAIGLWRAVDYWAAGRPAEDILLGVGALAAVGVIAAGILAAMAFGAARTTVYTITNRRVAMRVGVALNVTLNLPFRWIGSAALRLHGDGTGDIPLRLTGETKLAYLMLWPHARPWAMRSPEPCLRAVPDGARVAELLAQALRADVAQRAAPAPATAPASAPREGLIAAE